MADTFIDRRDAGRQLAERLKALRQWDDPVVLGLPRGGVPVAYEVALGLDAPLDVFLVRKLGVPGHEELAMGAIASGGVRVLNEDVIAVAGITSAAIDLVSRVEAQELERRERAYRGDRLPVPIPGRSVIVVDDGLATGASMRAAVAALRQQRPFPARDRRASRRCASLRGAGRAGRRHRMPPHTGPIRGRRPLVPRLPRGQRRRGPSAPCSGRGPAGPPRRLARAGPRRPASSWQAAVPDRLALRDRLRSPRHTQPTAFWQESALLWQPLAVSGRENGLGWPSGPSSFASHR